MTQWFGPVTQLGFVTRDIRKSMQFYLSQLGVGPWFLEENANHHGVLYRGAPSRGRYAIALANWKDLQLELIQPLDDEPSVYREWLDNNPANEVMHHVSTWPENYSECVAKAEGLGFEFVLQGGNARGGFCYLEHPANRGALIELNELSAARKRIWDAVAEAARHWDGHDPIRIGWPTI